MSQGVHIKQLIACVPDMGDSNQYVYESPNCPHRIELCPHVVSPSSLHFHLSTCMY